MFLCQFAQRLSYMLLNLMKTYHEIWQWVIKLTWKNGLVFPGKLNDTRDPIVFLCCLIKKYKEISSCNVDTTWKYQHVKNVFKLINFFSSYHFIKKKSKWYVFLLIWSRVSLTCIHESLYHACFCWLKESRIGSFLKFDWL